MSATLSATGNGRPPQLIDLALQGGGSHGAFTWGVLDRLLEESWLQIEAISGTSAGAMNAAVMADGHAKGDSRGAREALEAFWRSVSKSALFSPLQRSPIDRLLGRWTLDHSPAYVALDLLARVFSPYDLSFGRPNPLMQLLSDTVDFARLATAPIKLFITATNVRTGPRVFRNAELTAEVLLASACPWCGCRQIPDDVGVHGSVRWSHTDFTPRRPVNGVPPAVLRFLYGRQPGLGLVLARSRCFVTQTSVYGVLSWRAIRNARHISDRGCTLHAINRVPIRGVDVACNTTKPWHRTPFQLCEWQGTAQGSTWRAIR
jgi:hypothetical protein